MLTRQTALRPPRAGGDRRAPERAGAARALGIALVAAALAGALSLLLARSATITFGAAGWRIEDGSAGIDAVTAAALAALGALVAAWYALSSFAAAACALLRLVNSSWRAGERWLRRRGAPGVARLIGATGGAVLAASLILTPAQAEPPEPDPAPTLAEDLTWAAPSGGAAQSGSAASESTAQSGSAASESANQESPRPVSRSAERTAPTEYVVRTGDSLWSIAAAHLSGTPTTAQIAARWPRWYAANSAVIGPDPDLIHPGTVLRSPD